MSNIYIIGTEDKTQLKVGHSKDPRKRLSSLNTGRPDKLVLHYISDEIDEDKAYVVEQLIHKNIKDYRIKKEWFNIPYEKLLIEIQYGIMTYGYDDNIKTLYKNHCVKI